MNEELEIINQQPTKFSWKRIFKAVGVIVLIAAVVLGIYLFVTWRPVKIAWASWSKDRKETFLPCENLPFYFQAQKEFATHLDVVQKVRAIPGVVDFYPEEDKCQILAGGMEFLKGQAALLYSNRQARMQAESLIGQDFFGIPYRGEQK